MRSFSSSDGGSAPRLEARAQAGLPISMRPWRSLAKIRSGVLVVMALSRAFLSWSAALARSSAAVLRVARRTITKHRALMRLPSVDVRRLEMRRGA